MVYIRKKGAMAWPHPKYDNKSNYITLILYFGGSFKNTVYEGGDKLVFDWIKTNEFKFSDLVEFSAKAGVKGQNKYHIRLKSGSFKYVIDDEDLRVWANKFLDTREIHVYVEPFDGSENESETEAPNFLEIESDYDSFEDPDFVIGNELTDNDDEFFEGNVDTLEGDVESLDPKNIFDSTYHVWIELGGEGGNLGDGDSVGGDKGKNPVQEEIGGEGGNLGDGDSVGGDKGKNPVQEEIGGEGGNLGDGDSVGGDKGKNPVQEEIGGEGGNLGDGDSVGGGLGTKGRNVDSESEGEVEYEKDVVGGEGEYFDEHRLSEDDDETPNAPVFNPQTTFNPEFNVRQLFASKTEFRKAVQSGAIRDRRNVHFPKNDNRRIYAKCRDKFCGWHIHALKKQKETTFQIRKYNGIHTCVPSQKVKNLTATWLSERFIQKFQSDGNRDVNGFMLDAMYEVRCEVSYERAYRAKRMALSKLEGDADLQYTKLWAYAEELRKTNPGSSIILGTTDDNKFDRFYVCWNAMKRGFLGGCRPIVGVDGCFLKSKYGGNLLTAVGVDGNNNLFPVAYAVVDKENGEIWEWFLTILKRDLEINAEDFTFISDKQKGLIQAFHSVFPGAEHRFCVRHLHNNLKSAGFNGLAYKQILWKAAMSTTQGEFKARMDEMKELNLAAWEWFSNKPPEQWSKAYFSERSKCDMLLNNVCEAFNSNILFARDKAVITMLEWLREYLMKRLQKNRDIALVKWKGQLCPRIQKILEINTEKVSDCIPIKGNDIHYQVSCFDGLDPVAFVDECYSVRKYVKAYELPIYGISHDQLWGDTLYIPPLPPNFGTRGKITKKRRLEKDEKNPKGKGKKVRMRRQQTTIKCSKCKQEGHNVATCKEVIPETEGPGEGSGRVNPNEQNRVHRNIRRRTRSSYLVDEISDHEAVEEVVVATCKEVIPETEGPGEGSGRVNPNEQNRVHRNIRRRTRSSYLVDEISDHEAIEEVVVAPPRIRNQMANEDPVDEQHNDTQQSTTTNVTWNQLSPQPQQGPSQHDQLELGQPVTSRVQMRRPPQFGEGHFSRTPFVAPQQKDKTKLFVEGGQKYMDLSQSSSKTMKGKKKQT
ncbi:hypothetical protein ACS0TY_018142 [Phlomoides rotata]